MAPAKRRGRAAAATAGTSGQQLPAGPVATAGAGAGSGSGNGQTATQGSVDSDDESSGPAVNLMSASIMFGEEHGKRHKAKADQILVEAKQVAERYRDKVEAILLKQNEDIQNTYDHYAKQLEVDMQERTRLLKQIASNYAALERVRDALVKRTDDFEHQRQLKAAELLPKAAQTCANGHRAILRSVRMKKTAFSTSAANSDGHKNANGKRVR